MTRTCYTTLWGGASYTWPDVAVRRSLTDAIAVWDDRRSSGGHRRSVDDDGTFTFFPCWGDPIHLDDDGSWRAGFAWFIADDDPAINTDGTLDTTDLYPDRELRVGPRGGLRWVRY
jgi:hypothetical protein